MKLFSSLFGRRSRNEKEEQKEESPLLRNEHQRGSVSSKRTGRYSIGDRIQNRYEIYKIFSGGFGVVYICYDHEEHVPFAIKGFKEEFALNEKVIECFRREALEWVELERHQNIVRAYYVNIIEGRPYIFLEYIAGAEGVEGGHEGRYLRLRLCALRDADR